MWSSRIVISGGDRNPIMVGVVRFSVRDSDCYFSVLWQCLQC